MKKSELENGYLVERGDGRYYRVVLRNFSNRNKYDLLESVSDNDLCNLDCYDEELKCIYPICDEERKKFDIVRVYKLFIERDLVYEEFISVANKLDEIVNIIKSKYLINIEMSNYSTDYTVSIRFYSGRIEFKEHKNDIDELVRYNIKYIKEKEIDEIVEDISNKIDKLILSYFKL